MTGKSISDYFKREAANAVSLENKKFAKESFLDFTLRPSAGEHIKLTNVGFDNCSVEGSCVIRDGVTLKDVTFSNFSCSGALHISAETELDNVKIIGENRPSMIWVRSQIETDEPACSYVDGHITLDISKYFGEVSITGIPANTVKINPEAQVIIDVKLLDIVDWKALGFNPLSYWKLMAKKVLAEKSQHGVFSFPPESGRNYERSMSELAILREEGLVSSEGDSHNFLPS